MGTDIQEVQTLSIEQANALVVEHQGWAESIARSVARSWNLDWKLDGLDGAALEALIFCARRFQPARAVPFRGYARKRIHEASTEAARRSKGWQRGLGTLSKSDQQAREISAELFNIFPELREGQLPIPEEGGEGGDDMRSAVRQLLVGASIVAAKQGIATSPQDEVMDYKKMIVFIAALEPVHQALLWQVYWDGSSMRTVAAEWEVDELSVIREHKALLGHLFKCFSEVKSPPGKGPPVQKSIQKLKVRPALKHIGLRLKKENKDGAFTRVLARSA